MIKMSAQTFSATNWKKPEINMRPSDLYDNLHTASGAVDQRCSVKKVFLEISPNSHENTCAGDSMSPPTTTHHYPPPIKIYPLLPTTIYHQKWYIHQQPPPPTPHPPAFLTFTQFFQIVIEKNMFRSSQRRCSVTKGVLRNFPKFTGKCLRQSFFFNKVAELSTAILSKKRLWRRRFSCEFWIQNTSGGCFCML